MAEEPGEPAAHLGKRRFAGERESLVWHRQPGLDAADALPYASGVLAGAAPEQREALYAALDIQALYRQDKKQATITDATPQAINALLTDPRADSDTGTPASSGDARAEDCVDPFAANRACQVRTRHAGQANAVSP